MGHRPYLTAPQPLSTMPPGIPYIVGNEAAERFSFYGMKAILTVYMTQFLVGWDGTKATLSDEDAKSAVHLFVASAYFFPLLGAIVSDWLFGKYRTIIALSLVYCLGHLLLAVVPGREGLLLGLSLIALGSGGIKPCVSAHVGDQFGEQNKHLLSRVFSWFYFSINLGAFLSTLLTPILLREFGPHVAFGVPGVLMGLATLVFWFGRHKFAHIPPGGTEFLRESFSGEGLRAIGRLIPLFLFVSVFWALFDQTASAWVLQAEHMDRQWLGWTWESSQIQAANPILVMALIPIFAYVVYPLLDRVLPPSPLWRIAIGFFITAVSFSVSALIESWIDAGGTPNIVWQLLAYVILTAAEVMVSITCLEFSYTQAPNRMKSLIMSFYLLSVTLGNLLVSVINQVIQNPDGTTKLPGASYYWFFTNLMMMTAVVFLAVAATYRGRTYIQQEEAPVVV
jgi:proton-dependent oligopeptide transporter, POT family